MDERHKLPNSPVTRGAPEPKRSYEAPAVVSSLPFETLVLAVQGEDCLFPECTSDQNGQPCPG